MYGNTNLHSSTLIKKGKLDEVTVIHWLRRLSLGLWIRVDE